MKTMHNDEEIRGSRKTVKIADVIKTTLHHWPWIIVSVVVCVGLATAFVMTRQPTYKRTSKIVIKDESSGSSIGSQLSAFAGMGMLNSSTNIRDEISKLQSPDLMAEVVRILSLDMNYELPGRFHSKIVYGDSLPVRVILPQFSESDAASFKLTVSKNGDIRLSDVKRGTDRTSPVEMQYSQKAPIHFDKPVQTPLGTMIVTKGPNYKVGEEYSVSVSRQPIVAAANKYENEIDIKLVEQWGNTIELTALDNNLERADDLLNTLVKVYNESWVQTRNETSKATSRFINDRLVTLQDQLTGVDKDLADYQSANYIPDIREANVGYMTAARKSDEELYTISNRLQMTKYMQQYLANPAHRNEVIPANIGLANAGVEKMIDDFNKKLLGRNRLEGNSSASHPMIANLDRELQELYSSIEESINNEVTALGAQLRNAESMKGNAESRIAESPRQAKHLLSIDRQRKVMESLYTFLLQKREENELSQAFTPYNTEVVARPFGELRPVSPKKKLIVGFAFLFGLFLPFGVTFVRETTNTKVRGKKDLERLPIPLIGEIPLAKGKIKKEIKMSGINERIVVQPGSRDIINDAFRVLRTNVTFLSHRGSVLMVTSFNAGSGKSFVTINLAISLSLRDKKVIVVDGDLRHGSTSAAVGNPPKGISDYLSGHTDDWQKAVIHNEALHGAEVLPVGHFPPNPAELLESERFNNLITQLSDNYDYVLIDCPPINAMADAKIIEKLCDRCLFVVRVGHLELDVLPEIEKLYNEKTYRNMTLVLNGVDAASSTYGYMDGYHSKM